MSNFASDEPAGLFDADEAGLPGSEGGDDALFLHDDGGEASHNLGFGPDGDSAENRPAESEMRGGDGLSAPFSAPHDSMQSSAAQVDAVTAATSFTTPTANPTVSRTQASGQRGAGKGTGSGHDRHWPEPLPTLHEPSTPDAFVPDRTPGGHLKRNQPVATTPGGRPMPKPVLKGMLSFDGIRFHYTGDWAMTPDQYDAGNVSAFEYKGIATSPVQRHLPGGRPPAVIDGIKTPIAGTYAGYFFMKIGPKPVKVEEKAVTLEFRKSEDQSAGAAETNGSSAARSAPSSASTGKGSASSSAGKAGMKAENKNDSEAGAEAQAEAGAGAGTGTDAPEDAAKQETAKSEAAPETEGKGKGNMGPPPTPGAKLATKYDVDGYGTNRYGAFMLKGTLDTTTGRMILSKQYVPKTALPKKKKIKSKTPRGGFGTPARSAVDSLDAEMLSGSRTRNRRKSTPAHLRDSDVDPLTNVPEIVRRCVPLIDQLCKHTHAYPFLEPVDWQKLGIPDYPTIIKEPMDLGTVRSNLEAGEYQTIDDFTRDVRLIWRNAMTYNKPGTDVYIMASNLSEGFERKLKDLKDREKRTQERRRRSGPSGWAGAGGSHVAAPRRSSSSGGGSRKRQRATPRPSMHHHDGAAGSLIANSIAAMEAQLEQMKAMLRQIDPSAGVGARAAAEAIADFGTEPQQSHHDASMPAAEPELTYEEKDRLTQDINKLDAAKQDHVYSIVSAAMPISSDEGTVEISIDSVDTATLRKLQAYVKTALEPEGGATKRQRSAQDAAPAQEAGQAEGAAEGTADHEGLGMDEDGEDVQDDASVASAEEDDDAGMLF